MEYQYIYKFSLLYDIAIHLHTIKCFFSESRLGTNEKLKNDKSVLDNGTDSISEWKRTFQNDEEDIATLLANQLSNETCSGTFKIKS